MTSQIKIVLDSVDNGYMLTVTTDDTVTITKCTSVYHDLSDLAAAATKAMDRAKALFNRDVGNLP